MVRNRQAFGVGMGGVAHMCHTWLPENRFTRGQPAHGVELAEDLERIVAMYGADTIAACFVEPVAGSTGTLGAAAAFTTGGDGRKAAVSRGPIVALQCLGKPAYAALATPSGRPNSFSTR